MRKIVACSAGAKSCARQTIVEAFSDVLCGNFETPSQKEMENFLKDFIEYSFDEYQVKRKITAKHPGWDEELLANEVYRLKMRYDNKYRENLMRAAAEAISEIERLLSSLNNAIKEWRRKNLE